MKAGSMDPLMDPCFSLRDNFLREVSTVKTLLPLNPASSLMSPHTVSFQNLLDVNYRFKSW